MTSDTNAPQPTRGSLSMKIIRACREHAQCALDCPARRVLDLGEVASFDNRSMFQRMKENYDRWRHSSQTSEKP